MRINQFVARATGLSRRAADQAIASARVTINGQPAKLGDEANQSVIVRLDDTELKLETVMTVMLNKPVGYVCSRDGQGSPTIYELLSAEYNHLKPVGRLDKDSSGLLLLTNDGDLANQLTHPRFAKTKVYEIELDKPLTNADQSSVEQGVKLDDGLSKLSVRQLDGAGLVWQVTMAEGRKRQIRRTFEALGYQVVNLHRISFGDYQLAKLKAGIWKVV